MTSSVRCSAWARAAELDPVGSAGSYRGFVLVEVPLPWPRDVGDLPPIAHVRGLLARPEVRVQALVPVDAGGGRTLIAHLPPSRPGANGDGFAGFERREARYDKDVGAALATLLDTPGGAAALAPGTRDLLVCTHGRRDVCCGSLGTDLFEKLESVELPRAVRRWRTSHTGGHRFAPTFAVLPEATVWGFADADLVQQVLWRRGDAAEVADRYRGCAGLPGGPRVQALEREVLRRTGWGLLDRRRRGHDRGGSAPVLLAVEGTGGAGDVWEADVVPLREVPVPDCGRPVEAATKTQQEWTVGRLRRA